MAPVTLQSSPPCSFVCVPIITAYDHSAANRQASTDAVPFVRREGQITGVRFDSCAPW